MKCEYIYTSPKVKEVFNLGRMALCDSISPIDSENPVSEYGDGGGLGNDDVI